MVIDDAITIGGHTGQGWGVSIVEFAESEAQVPMEPWRVAWMREMRARDWLNDCQCNNVLAIGCPVHIIDGPTLCAENHDFDPTDYGPQVAAAILLVVHRGDMWGWGGEVGSRILPSVFANPNSNCPPAMGGEEFAIWNYYCPR